MKFKAKRTKKRKLASELAGGSHRGDSPLGTGPCQWHATERVRPIDHQAPEGRHRQCHHHPITPMPLSTSSQFNFPPHRLSHCGDSSAYLALSSSPAHFNSPSSCNVSLAERSDEAAITSSSGSPSHHRRRGHRPRHRVWQSLLMVTLLCAQMATVHAMLDALKALFILTGASTYLVTKYVNITNRTEGFNDGYGYFHAANTTGLHHFNLSRLNEFNPALNFFKGDLGNAASKPNGINSIRPMYVLAIEEEEDERTLPKVLLKLAISDHVDEQQSARANISHGIEYILDAKMDDLGPVLHNFQVNKTTGELFLIRPLDRDPPKGRAMWKFSVQARNRQTQFILAVADVLITVRDINDNKPLFEQKVYRTTLMENGPAGQILTKVTAIDFDDADTADNGKVVYSLLKSSTTHPGAASVYGSRSGQSISISDYFQIDPHTGVLTALACCFDREKRAEYKLVVRATDAGGLSDEATIVVTIGDLNDCPPKFTNPSRTLVLNDDSFNSFWLDQSSSEVEDPLVSYGANSRDLGLAPRQSNTLDENIATFYVSDDDLPETNHLSYEIVNSTNCSLFHRFYMVANDDGSGSLLGSRAKLNSALEYNRTYSCQLTIAVHDSVRDSASSSGQIYEDLASLTLIYRNNTPIKRTEQTSNAAVVAIDSNDPRGTLPKPRIEKDRQSPDSPIKFDENGQPASDQSHSSSGPKAYDLTGKRTPHSECSLCQNGGQCLNTETGYRFRCYCQAGFEGALCERSTHKSDIDRVLASITANELLFYGSLIVIVNLLVVVLGLMVWIVKRVRTTANNTEPSPHPAALEANLDLTPSGTIQVLPQPLMMTVMEPAEFKQALELDHYVIA